MEIKHLLKGNWELLPHANYHKYINDVSDLFGRADIDISYRKLKKQYIKTAFESDCSPEYESWAVIEHIGKSKLIREMFIKCVNQIHQESSIIWEMIYRWESLAVRYIKKRIIHPFGIIIEDTYHGCDPSPGKLVRAIKTFGKLISLNKGLRKIVNMPVSSDYTVSNIYALLIHNVNCDHLSKHEYFLLHIFILHRRNKVKFTVPEFSGKLYSALSSIAGSFVSKNLSRLSLYY